MVWVHRLLSVDGERGTCAHCGPVALTFKTRNGVPRPRCAVAVEEQRNTAGRHGGQLRDHGLTSREAAVLTAGTSCGICGSTKRLCLDHCHETGVIRGVLCSPCNLALGLFVDSQENLQAAISYLKATKAPAP